MHCTFRRFSHQPDDRSRGPADDGTLPVPSDRKTFDAAAEAARLRKQTRTRRRSRHAVSRLDRYTLELLALHDAGSTTAELQRWLRDRRIRVHHSTVARWLRRHLVD